MIDVEAENVGWGEMARPQLPIANFPSAVGHIPAYGENGSGFESPVRHVCTFGFALMRHTRCHLKSNTGEQLACSPPNLGEPGSIPGRITLGFSHVRIVPGDAAGRRNLLGISRFPRTLIPALLHAHFNHHHRISRPSCQEPLKSSTNHKVPEDFLKTVAIVRLHNQSSATDRNIEVCRRAQLFTRAPVYFTSHPPPPSPYSPPHPPSSFEGVTFFPPKNYPTSATPPGHPLCERTPQRNTGKCSCRRRRMKGVWSRGQGSWSERAPPAATTPLQCASGVMKGEGGRKISEIFATARGFRRSGRTLALYRISSGSSHCRSYPSLVFSDILLFSLFPQTTQYALTTPPTPPAELTASRTARTRHRRLEILHRNQFLGNVRDPFNGTLAAIEDALLHAHLPPRRTGLNPRPGHSGLSASGNRAGRRRRSAGLLGDPPAYPAPPRSGAAPHSLQSSSSALKTSLDLGCCCHGGLESRWRWSGVSMDRRRGGGGLGWSDHYTTMAPERKSSFRSCLQVEEYREYVKDRGSPGPALVNSPARGPEEGKPPVPWLVVATHGPGHTLEDYRDPLPRDPIHASRPSARALNVISQISHWLAHWWVQLTRLELTLPPLEFSSVPSKRAGRTARARHVLPACFVEGTLLNSSGGRRQLQPDYKWRVWRNGFRNRRPAPANHHVVTSLNFHIGSSSGVKLCKELCIRKREYVLIEVLRSNLEQKQVRVCIQKLDVFSISGLHRIILEPHSVSLDELQSMFHGLLEVTVMDDVAAALVFRGRHKLRLFRARRALVEGNKW
ncbi:hypothetical protein PR048_027566 [Dryococelus australis]|uniref:Uncharacterized protein n=1 Tax=Dryococelus australis TaxID=614101 RepID=A0ABQ9GGV3_9NEOP|nr:hypothetical protein PR048_027566 [Dryococelus australis]